MAETTQPSGATLEVIRFAFIHYEHTLNSYFYSLLTYTLFQSKTCLNDYTMRKTEHELPIL